MKLTVVAVYDRAAHVYGRPVCVPSEGIAMRQFHEGVNAKEGDMAKYPGDFDLFVIGTFDDQVASFECLPKPRLLVNGGSVKEQVAQDNGQRHLFADGQRLTTN